MRGNDVSRLRDTLGLDAFAFAKILGVHVSTLYRWEQVQGDVSMDPLQRDILEQLAKALRAKRAAQKREVGNQVLAALLAGGALGALAVLLAFITKSSIDDPDAATSRSNPSEKGR